MITSLDRALYFHACFVTFNERQGHRLVRQVKLQVVFFMMKTYPVKFKPCITVIVCMHINKHAKKNNAWPVEEQRKPAANPPFSFFLDPLLPSSCHSRPVKGLNSADFCLLLHGIQKRHCSVFRAELESKL